MMKKTLLATAVATLATGAARADISYDPYGYQPDPWKDVPKLDWDDGIDGANNVSKIRQDGELNTATVDQTASYPGKSGYQAMSVVVQTGKKNDAAVTEDLSDVRSFVYQEGKRNAATVELSGATHGVSTSVVEQFGTDHQADVTADGSLNAIGVYQHDKEQGAWVDVAGDENTVRSGQEGWGHDTTIGVLGDGNTVHNDQGGLGNTSTVSVHGDWNYAATNQWGAGNEAGIAITGDENSVRVFQDAVLSKADVTIDEGDFNEVLTYQLSIGSEIDIDIDGDANQVTAAQTFSGGDKIDIDLTNGSDRNRVQAFQGDLYASAGNVMTIALDGSWDNFVAAAQNGFHNDASVSISYGDFNVVKIDQYGSENVATSTVH